jgi:hypothetical protein
MKGRFSPKGSKIKGIAFSGVRAHGWAGSSRKRGLKGRFIKDG